MNDLLAKEEAADAAETKRLDQATWSDPKDPAGLRAAITQASVSITDLASARAALALAIRTNDKQQSKAVVFVSSEKGYAEVVNDYIKEYPTRALRSSARPRTTCGCAWRRPRGPTSRGLHARTSGGSGRALVGLHHTRTSRVDEGLLSPVKGGRQRPGETRWRPL